MSTPVDRQCTHCSDMGGFGFNHNNKNPRYQRGMGATIVLFTIALIVLVGAALAYASRGNPSAVNAQTARVNAAVLLQQSADYRDAFSRYIFDGGVAANMTFNAASPTSVDLFFPAAQYGVYQVPPVQAVVAPATPVWKYNNAATITDIGTTAADSIVVVPDLNKAVCDEINFQLYGTRAAMTSTPAVVQADLVAGTAVTITTTPTGRSAGCLDVGSGKYAFFSTLAEN